MNWRPGELDQLINIVRPVSVGDGVGGREVTLSNIATDLFAKAKPLSGSEGENSGKINASFSMMFVVRFRDDVKEDDRIFWSGDYYNIRQIQKSGTRELYSIYIAERGVAQ